MARCNYCDSFILFGGPKLGDLRFCKTHCYNNGYFIELSKNIPESDVQKNIWEIQNGSCPECKGPGPVDLYFSHQVWSALVFTHWESPAKLSCRSCARKSQVGALFFSGFLGWWGIPWGLVITPIQIIKNISAIFQSTETAIASPGVEKIVRVHFGSKIHELMENENAQPK
jgi:hypothetical protein